MEAVSPGDALQIGKGLQLTLLRASDDRGRRVPGALTSVASSGRHDFELKPAANAKLVNLTFAVVKDRVAEFIVKPSWR